MDRFVPISQQIEDDEIVGDQSHQGLAKRAQTRRVPRPQILEAKPRTGRETALEYVAAELIEDVRRDGARGLAFGSPAHSGHV